MRGASTQLSQLPGGTVPAHDGSGPLHVCFDIREEYPGAWERGLEAQGVSVESHVRWPAGAISLYFRDAAGQAEELATPGLWGK